MTVEGLTAPRSSLWPGFGAARRWRRWGGPRSHRTTAFRIDANGDLWAARLVGGAADAGGAGLVDTGAPGWLRRPGADPEGSALPEIARAEAVGVGLPPGRARRGSKAVRRAGATGAFG
jgi:hypothetical protein